MILTKLGSDKCFERRDLPVRPAGAHVNFHDNNFWGKKLLKKS